MARRSRRRRRDRSQVARIVRRFVPIPRLLVPPLRIPRRTWRRTAARPRVRPLIRRPYQARSIRRSGATITPLINLQPTRRARRDVSRVRITGALVRDARFPKQRKLCKCSNTRSEAQKAVTRAFVAGYGGRADMANKKGRCAC